MLLIPVAAAVLVAPLTAWGFDPFVESPPAEEVEKAPAFRYASMTGAQALAALRARKVLFQQEKATYGVETPIRLTSRLHGVHFHTMLPEAARTTSPFEICDARLALALDDFAAILEAHGIDEVQHFSMYRPGSPPHTASAPLPHASVLPQLPAASGASVSASTSAPPRGSARAIYSGLCPPEHLAPSCRLGD